MNYNVKTKVFLVCSGLGRINRGFETFAQECFDELSQDCRIDITLFKGGGKSNHKQTSIYNIPRESWAGVTVGKLTGRGAYFIEQTSFAASLLPHIYRQRPDIIYFSDGGVGNLLWHWREKIGLNFKLLFSNGGPLSPPFSRWDLIQQVAPQHMNIAIENGELETKHLLVPYGIKINSKLTTLLPYEKDELKRKLGLPIHLPIVLSVAAVNKTHKRIDYLIREISQLPKPRPYLIILGQIDSESAEIIELAHELLEVNTYQIRTVNSLQIKDYYRIADLFVLTSLREGFGRVFLEAMSYGLPCLAHDYEIPNYVLKEEGYLANLHLKSNLAKLIDKVLIDNNEKSKYRRHAVAYENFSWDRLRSNYIEMINYCKKSG